MLDRTAELVKSAANGYANYEFHRVITPSRLLRRGPQRVLLRRAKGSLVHQGARNNRAAPRKPPCEISSALVRLAAPILVFTSEEIGKYLPKAPGRNEACI